jgi:type IV fimbrial biogenesis protein FimT
MIELMVSLTVLGVLAAIALPSFNDAFLSNRLASFSNSFIASAQLARSEAIKRNVPVRLCASSDGATCAAAGGWEQGWIVIDAANEVIQRQESLPGGFKLTQGGGTAPLTFEPIGIGMGAATFTVCRNDPVGNQERVLSVRAAGSAQVTTTEAGVCP